MISLMNAVELIQVTLVPVIFISAVGLVGLIIQTRYGRVHDRVRFLLSERRGLDMPRNSKRAQDIDVLIKKLLGRARLLKWAMIIMFCAIVDFVLDSLLTLLNILSGVPSNDVIAAVFALGMLFVATAAVLTVVDASESMSYLNLEVAIETQV